MEKNAIELNMEDKKNFAEITTPKKTKNPLSRQIRYHCSIEVCQKFQFEVHYKPDQMLEY